MKVLLLLLLLLPLVSCGGEEGAVEQQAPVAEEEYVRPPEYILAGIDGPGAAQDMGRLRTMLDAITAKCSNDPREITDAIVEIKAILDRKGIEISTVELMQHLEQNIPARSDGPGFDFTQVAASFRNLSPEPASR